MMRTPLIMVCYYVQTDKHMYHRTSCTMNYEDRIIGIKSFETENLSLNIDTMFKYLFYI
jgi:hypothetical protein